MNQKIKKFVSSVAVLFLFGACSSYTAVSKSARTNFYDGEYAEAAKKLEKGAYTDGKDRLLYLLDRATALHQAGDFQQSNKDFLSADKLAEISDYTSLSEEAATFLTSDEIKYYKGEEFEYVLISQYLAINYLMLKKYEDALVECRRVNHKLYLLKTQGKRKYELNPMAQYLAAMIYEDQGEYDNAYIDYKNVFDILPDFPYLREDLYRMAWKNKDRQAMDQWVEHYNLSAQDKDSIKKRFAQAEVVFIVENGKSPEKQPNPNWHSLPRYLPRANPVTHVNVTVKNEPASVPLVSQKLYDIEKIAIQNLDEKFGGLVAKKLTGVVAKEVLANEVGKRTDPLVGFLLKMGMYAGDRADTRSWLTLPKDFQIVRLRLEKEGEYAVELQPMSGDVPQKGGMEKKILVAEPVGRKIQRDFIPVRIL